MKAFSVLLCVASALVPAALAQTPAEIQSKMDNVVAEAVSGKDVAVEVGVIAHGQTMMQGYGETAHGNRRQPNGGTLFEIGSVTKVFTATMLAYAVKHGRVKLDDPLEKYIPARVPAFEGRRIELADLATHTACLPRDIPGGRYPTSPQQAFDFLGSFRLTCKPGSKYLYSNLGWGLLGIALARALNPGYGWEPTAIRYVIGPLGLTDTRVTLGDDQATRKAQGYDNGKATEEPSAGFPAFNSSGALWSSMDNMLKFMKFNLGDGDYGKDLLPLLQTPRFKASDTMSLGLGWEVRAGNGHPYFTKDGRVHGFRAFVAFDRTAQVAVVVLINNINIAPGKDVGYKIMSFLRKTADESNDDESGEPANSE